MIPLLPNTGLIPINSAIVVAIITAIPPTIIAIIALYKLFKHLK